MSIDLDPIDCYYQIHALGAPPPGLADVVLRRALPRFVELFSRHKIASTLFVVARDCNPNGPVGAEAAAAARAQFEQLFAAGHEIASHSYAHAYDLAKHDKAAIRDDLNAAHVILREICGGKPPTGFRSPGYDVSVPLFEVLAELGYHYDSSIFPAPLYYAAKTAVMGAMKLLGRESGAVLGDARALIAPTDPYRPDPTFPWRRGQSSLIELPITVTPWLRIPAIGTSLLLASSGMRATLLEQVRVRPFFNLELHGIDLIDADADGIPGELVAKQPDLRRPLDEKLRTLEATFDRLAAEYDFVPLNQIAAAVQRGELGLSKSLG